MYLPGHEQPPPPTFGTRQYFWVPIYHLSRLFRFCIFLLSSSSSSFFFVTITLPSSTDISADLHHRDLHQRGFQAFPLCLPSSPLLFLDHKTIGKIDISIFSASNHSRHTTCGVFAINSLLRCYPPCSNFSRWPSAGLPRLWVFRRPLRLSAHQPLKRLDVDSQL